MTTVVSFVAVIGILILIHELGHFLVARWVGVGVERFSIGFGRVLVRWRGKETEYCLSAIPMGGYVKMMGEENPLEGGETLPYDSKKAFALKPLWARFLIVFAGPGMNFVLAAVIVAVVLASAGRPVWPAVAGRVAEDGPAAAAGLRSGDVITAIEGRPVSYWEDVDRAVAAANGRALALTVKRGDTTQTVQVTPQKTTIQDPILREEKTAWEIGASAKSVPQISSVGAGSPAETAGLRPGDVVIEIAGQHVYSREDLIEAIRARPGQVVAIGVEREGRRLTLNVTPNVVEDKSAKGEVVKVGRIEAQIGIQAMTFVAYHPVPALWHGLTWTKDMTVMTIKGFGKLVVGTIDRSNIGGPIQIASMAGQQAREGLAPLAMFTAIISVNLAVLNLLPVPMLDGGHLFFFVIEAVLGRPLSLRKREAAQQVGFVLLMLLMVYALYNDVVRLNWFNFLK